MLPRTLLLGFLVSCLCLPGLGCGMMSSGTGLPQVSGTVTLDGEPLEDGRIVFRDPAGVASGAGGKIQNGQFSLEVTPGSKSLPDVKCRENLMNPILEKKFRFWSNTSPPGTTRKRSWRKKSSPAIMSSRLN